MDPGLALPWGVVFEPSELVLVAVLVERLSLPRRESERVTSSNNVQSQ